MRQLAVLTADVESKLRQSNSDLLSQFLSVRLHSHTHTHSHTRAHTQSTPTTTNKRKKDFSFSATPHRHTTQDKASGRLLLERLQWYQAQVSTATAPPVAAQSRSRSARVGDTLDSINSAMVPPPPRAHQQQQQQQQQLGVDEFVLNEQVLQQRLHKYLDQAGVRKFEAGVLQALDFAVQARLRSVLEALVRARRLRSHRLAGRTGNNRFTALPVRVTSDPGAALRFAERLMRAAEQYRATADEKALRQQQQQQPNNNGKENDTNDNDDDGDDDGDDDDDDDKEGDGGGDEDDDGEDDGEDDADADVDDKKRKRGGAKSKADPKGKRAKVAGDGAAAAPSEEMTQAEAARQARLERLKAQEEQRRQQASMDSAAAVALGNVGGAGASSVTGPSKEELQQKLKEREEIRDKIKKRLVELNFKESDRALLLKLRSLKAGPMEPPQVQQLRTLELRWEAFKKLSESASAFAKDIENIQQLLTGNTHQQQAESEAEHNASRLSELQSIVNQGTAPTAPVALPTPASVPEPPQPAAKRRRKPAAGDDEYAQPKAEPAVATRAAAAKPLYSVEPEAERPLEERLAAYVTPLITLDDCQLLRNTDIPSHVFDRFEIAQLKQSGARS
jgi:hypothetical protein